MNRVISRSCIARVWQSNCLGSERTLCHVQVVKIGHGALFTTAIAMAAERAEAATQQKDGFPSENGVKGSGARVISLEECNQHTREDSCWLIVHGKVLDVTEFLDEHPGGLDILLQSTGGLVGCISLHY